MPGSDVRSVAERAARTSYGHLLALVAAVFWTPAAPSSGGQVQEPLKAAIELHDAGKIAEAITDRELRTKGARAPLHNPKARDGWKPGDGLMVLDYNWSVMQRIVRDIIQGADDAAA